ncbi:glycosyl transferase [Hanstruepera neustonica]|uniref:Glycosyl transferase n=1 Tax=Hanstruepera neustonica TaxID=1445657 RepID=A0A2K1E090_9FLAO|nr:glycosyltransferase family 2 protein [Hanstruepera neustonica]PNQ73664.1 glycosyl transferase [Hanstruepera neustonica]
MTSTLLISTYNWPEALELVLMSVLKQKLLPNEVVIADDGSTESTKDLIEKFKKDFPINIRHIWHEDNGFTKTVILNKALKTITSDYIIQVDGDIILHPYFIKDHLTLAKKGMYLFGSRTSLTKKYSQKILKEKRITFSWIDGGMLRRTRAIYFPIYNLTIKAKHKNSSKLRGCNMSYWTSDALNINGYNEDYVGWGYEDFDFAQRLLHSGLAAKRIKHAAIQYHIFHKEAKKGDTDKGNRILAETIDKKISVCKNGIKKL